jgi:uncharacterized protein with HEPN domain
MRPDPESYLRDVLEMNEYLQGLLSGIDVAGYEADERVQRITERCLEIVGEALRQLSDMNRDVAEWLPGFRAFISLRNVIAHQYAVLESDIIWAAAKNRLPEFGVHVAALLSRLEGHGVSPEENSDPIDK